MKFLSKEKWCQYYFADWYQMEENDENWTTPVGLFPLLTAHYALNNAGK